MPQLATALASTMGPWGWLALALACIATAPAGIRWLRVAQREHYLADACSRFALRWWVQMPLNAVLLTVAGVGLVLSVRWPSTAIATAVAVAVGPLGLRLRGRTSALVWTRRLRTLAVTWIALQGALVGVGLAFGVGPLAAAAGALSVPAVVDISCLINGPLERRLARPYVTKATERLRRLSPKVVAITGSYGKTSTKVYLSHLVAGTYSVVASPASFNNAAGLSRAVNENLAEGTEVFVAEMGAYGRGEIEALCDWVHPDVSVITAIGPVHLERFGSEEEILAAKSEIIRGVACAVLAVDDQRLASLAERALRDGARVWRCSSIHSDSDVYVHSSAEGLSITAKGSELARGVPVDAVPLNLACAVAAALELGVSHESLSRALASLPKVAHRLEVLEGAGGVTVLDDTYNSNPPGTLRALGHVARLAAAGSRRVVVTPGMVELGPLQESANSAFAKAAAQVATDIVVVGRTNRRALVEGAKCVNGPNGPDVVLAKDREHAVTWVKDNLGAGDVVLYENDLPDHYP